MIVDSAISSAAPVHRSIPQDVWTGEPFVVRFDGPLMIKSRRSFVVKSLKPLVVRYRTMNGRAKAHEGASHAPAFGVNPG